MTKPSTPARLGSGELHQALVDADNATRLAGFVRSTGCDASEVSDDGKKVSWSRVFAAMRQRGYAVSEPVLPQAQRVAGFDTWLVTIGVAGAQATIAVFTPKESR